MTVISLSSRLSPRSNVAFRSFFCFFLILQRGVAVPFPERRQMSPPPPSVISRRRRPSRRSFTSAGANGPRCRRFTAAARDGPILQPAETFG